MTVDDGFVLPKPAIPKTFGILNLIIGVLGILSGLCLLGYAVATPVLMQLAERSIKEEQAKDAERRKVELAALDAKVAAAKSEAETTVAVQEKADYLAESPSDVVPDFSSVSAMVGNPVVIAHACAFNGIGVLLNIFLIASGIGLIKLAPWGRSMAVWLAWITIVSLGILAATDLLIVQPVNAKLTAKMINDLEAKAQTQVRKSAAASASSPAPDPTTSAPAPSAAPTSSAPVPAAPAPAAPALGSAGNEGAKFMATMGAVKAIAAFVFLSIYPIITLIAMTRPAARAACLPKPV